MKKLNSKIGYKNDSPKHIAIIMDGNRRWAHKNFVPISKGYQKGADTLKKLILLCNKNDISELSVFAFSTENWCRPQSEILVIVKLIEKYLRSEIINLNTNNINVNFIGNKERLKPRLKNLLEYCQELTSKNSGLKLNIAINYGGRDDIIHAVNSIVKKVSSGLLTSENISYEHFEQFLYSKNVSNVDLLIRTGGEQRISNFFLWQTCYSELYFCYNLWPDFNELDFNNALDFYSMRKKELVLLLTKIKNAQVV